MQILFQFNTSYVLKILAIGIGPILLKHL